MGRAGSVAGGAVFLVNGIDRGYTLGIGNVGRSPQVQPLVKFIGNRYRAYLGTISTAGTFIRIYIA